jgi:hypothetical protein
MVNHYTSHLTLMLLYLSRLIDIMLDGLTKSMEKLFQSAQITIVILNVNLLESLVKLFLGTSHLLCKPGNGDQHLLLVVVLS